MRRTILSVLAALFSLSTAASTTISFVTEPFAGSDALTAPGRQIVGGEAFVTFLTASDIFAFDPRVFGAGNQVPFANDVAGSLPVSGVKIVVLQTLDDDSDPTTPFGAGNAANLIANQITSSGPGFFVYFSSELDLPRLVFTTDLSENTADLKILARIINLSGQEGRDALPTFTASNFAMLSAIPEPSSLSLLVAPVALWALGHGLRRRRTHMTLRRK